MLVTCKNEQVSAAGLCREGLIEDGRTGDREGMHRHHICQTDINAPAKREREGGN